MTRRAEMIRAAIDNALSEMRVALPARVESVDTAAQTVDVRPMLLQRSVNDDGEVTTEQLPVLPTVPVSWPRGGGFFVSMPLTVGDTGLVVFCDWSIDQWRSRGGSSPADPLDIRAHSIASAVFVPGLHDAKNPLASVHAENLVVGKDDGSQIHIKPNGDVALTAETPAASIARADRADSDLQAIKSNVDQLRTAFAAWVPVPNDGGAALKAAATAWSSSTITLSGTASDKVKGD